MKRVIVTAALPYANGEIHLGHVASTYLPSDIFVKFLKLKKYEVVYVCATDDYGTPILIRAEQENKKPEDYVSYWNERDLKDFKDLGIDFDIFYKTSSKENSDLAQYFFIKLYEKGYIYKKKILQFYCEFDKKFLPDRYVIGTCPYCKAENQYSDGCEKCGKVFEAGEIINPKCSLCGREPINKESEHYFFALSKFSSKLEDWLKSNNNLQEEVKNYVLNWIKEGLKDWDISRDISWGIPIPLSEAKGKVLYGWFENHLCYISTTLKYLRDKNLDGKEFWNSSIIYHFIGKDIVYHHYLFLPAMRMGLDEEYKLPDFIPTRGHLLLHRQKFSKSRGWYVSLREYLDSFPPDYLRFYLASITPYSQADVNFDWDEFMVKINNELVANLGNFIHRVLSFTYNRLEGKVPEYKEKDSLDEELIREMKETKEEVAKRIMANEMEKGLKRILDFSDYCNKYFQKKEPWVKEENIANCIFFSLNAVKFLSIVLYPYLPFSCKKIWEQLNLGSHWEDKSWDLADDLSINPKHKISKPYPLFRKIEKKAIDLQQKKLGKVG
ncbi:Methionine--tRNA ligase [archaeon HR06]|nr:Methionine--tRNA ligase [archaeon HR06]